MELIIKFYPPEENGRKVLPDLSTAKYRPHLVIDNDPKEAYLGVQFISAIEPIMFNKDIGAIVKLPYPNVDYSGLLPGVSFVIKEGRNTVGVGRVKAL